MIQRIKLTPTLSSFYPSNNKDGVLNQTDKIELALLGVFFIVILLIFVTLIMKVNEKTQTNETFNSKMLYIYIFIIGFSLVWIIMEFVKLSLIIIPEAEE